MYSVRPRSEVYCVRLNFNISKLVHWTFTHWPQHRSPDGDLLTSWVNSLSDSSLFIRQTLFIKKVAVTVKQLSWQTNIVNSRNRFAFSLYAIILCLSKKETFFPPCTQRFFIYQSLTRTKTGTRHNLTGREQRHSLPVSSLHLRILPLNSSRLRAITRNRGLKLHNIGKMTWELPNTYICVCIQAQCQNTWKLF